MATRPSFAASLAAVAILAAFAGASATGCGHSEPTPPGAPAAASGPAEASSAPPSDAGAPPAAAGLSPDSTLADWLAAGDRERSALAVALARRAVGTEAPKLDLARAAMEITGCLTRTASDPAMSAWKVGATASMCLGAEER